MKKNTKIFGLRYLEKTNDRDVKGRTGFPPWMFTHKLDESIDIGHAVSKADSEEGG